MSADLVKTPTESRGKALKETPGRALDVGLLPGPTRIIAINNLNPEQAYYDLISAIPFGPPPGYHTYGDAPLIYPHSYGIPTIAWCWDASGPSTFPNYMAFSSIPNDVAIAIQKRVAGAVTLFLGNIVWTSAKQWRVQIYDSVYYGLPEMHSHAFSSNISGFCSIASPTNLVFGENEPSFCVGHGASICTLDLPVFKVRGVLSTHAVVSPGILAPADSTTAWPAPVNTIDLMTWGKVVGANRAVCLWFGLTAADLPTSNFSPGALGLHVVSDS